MKDDTGAAAAACTILSIEPEGATRDIEQELLLVDAPLFGVNPLHKAKAMVTESRYVQGLPYLNVQDRSFNWLYWQYLSHVTDVRGGCYEIIIRRQCSTENPAASTAPRAPPRPSRDRTSSLNYSKGQIARSQPVPTSSFSSSVVEFVHDVTLQHHSQAHMVEKVEWVELHTIERAGQPSRRMDLVVLGLARGFQVWTFNESGDCEEVMSERQGPIRAFVPLSGNFELHSDEIDMYVRNLCV
ncbi:unnamed protein product [Haemonchus placei]|uniref:BCAS3 domain-containing protein n=1 Tax=Haemonchus placei TaxID=6290 RepID=A0A0N4WNZ5_HAEPC|nr:unnamed protein product [Haemonchus placei]